MFNLRVLLIVAATSLPILIGLVSDNVAIAQDEPAVAESESSTPVDAAPDDETKEQGRQAAVAGLLLLSLVCVVFLFLILFVVMWARRMRRLVNQPLPDQHPGDPLWYLRKPDAAAASDED